MGDLDISLIKEFALRPAFYNKTSANYKDKHFVEHAWQEISHKLGYNAALLKDRMYQLRNRYNLEKRKVETMRCDGLHNPKSSWPLFQHLKFLDGHIRPRKSYKTMMKRSMSTHDDDGDESPIVEIKYERHDETNGSCQNGYETDDGSINPQSNGDNFVNPANLLSIDDTESENDPNIDGQMVNNSNNNSTTSYQNQIVNLRNINSLKRTIHNVDEASKSQKFCRLMSSPGISPTVAALPQPHDSSNKFRAFGSFLTSSLLDLPETKALELVEKFTNELVKALMQKE